MKLATKMKTFYDTTRATWTDTGATAKGKWLQQLAYPSTTAAGMLAEPDNVVPRFHDTRVKVLQKIITKLQ